MITKTALSQKGDYWMNITTDEKETLTKFYQEYKIDEEIVAYSLDKNERAHLDYDKNTNTFVLIFNVPKLEKIDDHYETVPMTFIVKDTNLITVTNKTNHYVFYEMKKYLEKDLNTTIFSFLFGSLFTLVDLFFPYVEEMNSDRKLINNKLKDKTTKQNLLLLSDLETGIVYFVSASKQNVMLLEQVKAHYIYRLLNEEEKEELEDVLIEAKQLVEMTQLSSQILQQLSGTYNNVLNNNLNDTMKILTVLSILLTIPTIITGFFGMNMPLPLEHNVFGWLITILISVALWFGLSLILRRLMK
ncbi:magnesium transporter CorA family protein [Enterococcus wangshanyuanii]|uniref:Magnesium transporter n=1 Tax=Enterococcus wangshanyuanii TaxID=2005703 RepID=A0ABQ1NPF0_9ENTE|nr:magnesium transporter [Enterococcus wangshanyuanii]